MAGDGRHIASVSPSTTMRLDIDHAHRAPSVWGGESGGGEEDLPEGRVLEEQHGYAEGGGDQGDQEEGDSQACDAQASRQIVSDTGSSRGGPRKLLGPAVAFRYHSRDRIG